MAHLNCPAGDRRIETLSGGEKRRVAMCRAIVSQPDFLMLDEPTNHLDPESIEWVAEFLENFTARFSSSRTTAIFSTAWPPHD
jgi:ATPase subunit of ABC transporter with duplicated ATPase domains